MKNVDSITCPHALSQEKLHMAKYLKQLKCNLL